MQNLSVISPLGFVNRLEEWMKVVMVFFGLQVWVKDLSFFNIFRFSMEKVCDNTGEDPTCSR